MFAAAVLVSACTGYSLDCGPMSQADCAGRRDQIVTVVSREFPSRHISSIVISNAGGDAEVVLDDGSKVAFGARLGDPFLK
jgi:hypothetical protein